MKKISILNLKRILSKISNKPSNEKIILKNICIKLHYDRRNGKVLSKRHTVIKMIFLNHILKILFR